MWHSCQAALELWSWDAGAPSYTWGCALASPSHTLLQLPVYQAAQGRRWQWRAGWGRPAGAQSSSRPELQYTALQTAPRPQVVEHCGDTRPCTSGWTYLVKLPLPLLGPLSSASEDGVLHPHPREMVRKMWNPATHSAHEGPAGIPYHPADRACCSQSLGK